MSIRWLIVIATSLCLASVARATVIAEDGFAYTAGTDLRSQNGGTGWAGAWTGVATGATGSFAIKDLTGEPAGVAATGSALFLNGKSSATRVFRAIDLSSGSAASSAGLVTSTSTIFGTTASELGKPGTTLWLGFIARGDATSISAGTHLFEGVGSGTDNCTNAWTHTFTESDKLGENIFIGRGGGNANYGYERTCGHGSGCTAAHSVNLCNGNDYQSTIPFSSGVVHWVVVRMDFGTALTTSDATAATVTMWVDPTPGSTDPDVSTGTQLFEVGVTNVPKDRAQWVVSQFYFNTVELQSVTGGAAFDEYRLGTTFADVVGTGAAPLDLLGVAPADLTGVPIVDLASPDLTMTSVDLFGADLTGADLASTPPDLGVTADALPPPTDGEPVVTDGMMTSDAIGVIPIAHTGCGCNANAAELPQSWLTLSCLMLLVLVGLPRRARRS